MPTKPLLQGESVFTKDQHENLIKPLMGLARLMKYVKVTNHTCWEWTGPLNSEGYGRLNFQGRCWLPHRLMLHLLGVDVQWNWMEQHIDHRCRNRKCVNPMHLEPVTPSENAFRRWEATPVQKTCARGHEGYVRSYGCQECRNTNVKQLARRRGVRARSELVGMLMHSAKLTDEIVLEIRKNCPPVRQGRQRYKQAIAEKYKVSFSLINKIIGGKIWKHLL